MDDPAMDLAIACSLISSFEDVAIPQQYCFAAEVGLSGELRAVNRIEQRIMEAEKLGMETIVISKHNMRSLQVKKFNIEVRALGKWKKYIRDCFNK